MVVITEIHCESNVFCGGGDLSIISFNSTGDYHKKGDYQVIRGVTEEVDNEKGSTVDLLEWLKINGFSQKCVNNEQVFVKIDNSESLDSVELDVNLKETVELFDDNIHVDEQTQIEVKDYPTVIFPDTFVTPEIDIEFGSLGPFKNIHIEIEPKRGGYNYSFDINVNEIKSVSSLETESETITQKTVLSVEEKDSDDQTEKVAEENNEITETQEATEITEIEKTDEKISEVIENKEIGKAEELTKEEIEAKLEEDLKAKKAMRKKRKAEEARTRAEKRAQKEAEERAHKELKEAQEKEKARLKRLKKKGKKRTGGGNIKGGDMAGSNESKEMEYTNEKQDQCSPPPPPPRAPAAAMTMRSKGWWRPMVVAATLIPVMFALNITNFF